MSGDKLTKLLDLLGKEIARLRKSQKSSKKKLESLEKFLQKNLMEAESRSFSETMLAAKARLEGKAQAFKSILAFLTRSKEESKNGTPVKEVLTDSQKADKIRRTRDARRMFNPPLRRDD